MENINIEQVINKWFEMKYRTYDKLEHKGSIYLYYEGEKYADIRIDRKDEYVYYIRKLHEEFSEIIPNKNLEFEMVMSKWVGDTFGLKGFIPAVGSLRAYVTLEIPK